MTTNDKRLRLSAQAGLAGLCPREERAARTHPDATRG